MCVGQYSRLRVDVVVVTPFYTLACVLSSYFSPVALQIIICHRPLQGGRYPYVYVDGIYLRRNWGGEYENVAVLVAIAVNEDGFREV